jgi:ribosomal protein L19
MTAVRRDAEVRMNVRMASLRPAPLPNFRVGDAVELTYAMESSEKEPMPIRGTVLGKWSKGIDSKFTIINSWDGEWWTASYTYSSPLLRAVRIMQRNRVTEGLKRARRAKLTHLLEADHGSFVVNANTKEASVAAQDAKKTARDLKAKGGKGKASERSAKAGAAGGGKGAAAAPAAGKAGAAPAKAGAAPAKAPAKK